jgi:hypothetical protein
MLTLRQIEVIRARGNLRHVSVTKPPAHFQHCRDALQILPALFHGQDASAGHDGLQLLIREGEHASYFALPPVALASRNA